MSGCGCEMEARNDQERKTLLIVLGINAFIFAFEMVLGIFAQSTGLIADSLDMLADASVYAISLYAVGKSNVLKAKSAKLSGLAQILLALLVLADVLRRFILGSEPVSVLMMGVGVIALVANAICLSLIAKHRDSGVHMRASLIFSKNDVIANLGVIVAGALVWALGSRYPDLVIGSLIAIVVFRGGLQILRESAEYKNTISCESTKST
ncbi:MAG: cation transporter [Acidobacteria bacterium]|nr:cation transporter [Acidobacteriota bacterium]